MIDFLYFLFFTFVALFLIYQFLTRKYLNPYQLYILFGKKGCGKSTLLQKLVRKFSRKGWNCYCNIGDSSMSGCIAIPIKHFLPRLSKGYYDSELRAKNRTDLDKAGYFDVPDHVNPHSVIFCDEINLLFDNRDFAKFSSDTQEYFRLQRHYKHKFIGFSQTFDCDKKIRDLADYLIIIKKRFRVFVRCKAYTKSIVVVRPKAENARDVATMTDDFQPMGFLWDFFSPFHAFIPRWVKIHNSFKIDVPKSHGSTRNDKSDFDLDAIFSPSADGKGSSEPKQ